jgi:hypothetical protein
MILTRPSTSSLRAFSAAFSRMDAALTNVAVPIPET